MASVPQSVDIVSTSVVFFTVYPKVRATGIFNGNAIKAAGATVAITNSAFNVFIVY